MSQCFTKGSAPTYLLKFVTGAHSARGGRDHGAPLPSSAGAVPQGRSLQRGSHPANQNHLPGAAQPVQAQVGGPVTTPRGKGVKPPRPGKK
jgi:hypothetical protein